MPNSPLPGKLADCDLGKIPGAYVTALPQSSRCLNICFFSILHVYARLMDLSLLVGTVLDINEAKRIEAGGL